MSAQLSRIPIERSNGFKPSLLPELLLSLRHLTVQFSVLDELLVKLDKLDDALYEKRKREPVGSQ